jgi:uncharacterized glyoxalase superfamily protein PhnB
LNSRRSARGEKAPSSGEHDDRIASGVEIAMQVDGVDAWHDQLKVAGVPIARGLVDNPWGDRSFGINDPEGVRL